MKNKKTKLKEMRELAGLSQSQLAKMSQVHLRTLQYYEQGRLNFNHAKFESILSIAIALGCDVENILDDENVICKIKQYQNI